jgi:hypothetical protein
MKYAMREVHSKGNCFRADTSSAISRSRSRSANNFTRIVERETQNNDTQGLGNDTSRATDNHSGICSIDGNADNEMANPMDVAAAAMSDLQQHEGARRKAPTFTYKDLMDRCATLVGVAMAKPKMTESVVGAIEAMTATVRGLDINLEDDSLDG